MWEAISSVAAVVAVILSVVALTNQRRTDRAQVTLQQRLALIEEQRRADEVSKRDAELEAARRANISAVKFQLVQGGRAQDSDRVSITLFNAGQAKARGVDVAMLEGEDRAKSAGLGESVEQTEDVGGFSGTSPLHYYQIPWSLPGGRPLKELGPGEAVTLAFWHRYRIIEAANIRITWEDDGGRHVTRAIVPFVANPTDSQ